MVSGDSLDLGIEPIWDSFIVHWLINVFMVQKNFKKHVEVILREYDLVCNLKSFQRNYNSFQLY